MAEIQTDAQSTSAGDVVFPDPKNRQPLPLVRMSGLQSKSSSRFIGEEAQKLREAGNLEREHLRKVFRRRQRYYNRIDVQSLLLSRILVEGLMQSSLELTRYQVVAAAVLPTRRLGRVLGQRTVTCILLGCLKVVLASFIAWTPGLRGKAAAAAVTLVLTYPLDTIIAQLTTRRAPNLHLSNLPLFYRGVVWAALKLLLLRGIFTKGGEALGTAGACVALHAPWLYPHSHELRCPILVGCIAHAVISLPFDVFSRAAQTAPLPTPPSLAIARLLAQGDSSTVRSGFSTMASTFATAVTGRSYFSTGSVKRWVRYAMSPSVVSTAASHSSLPWQQRIAARGRRMARRTRRLGELLKRDAVVGGAAFLRSLRAGVVEIFNGAAITYHAAVYAPKRFCVYVSVCGLLAVLDALQAAWLMELVADTTAFVLWQKDSAERMNMGQGGVKGGGQRRLMDAV